MSSGDFFSGFWQWSSSLPVEFQITDIDVISDQFQIYDQGALVATTPSMPQWQDLISIGVTDPFQSPPYTDDPSEAFNSGYYSRGDLFFSPGSHSITISDIAIPIDPTGVPFPDGGVAFRAFMAPEPVPEPSTAFPVGFLVLLLGTARYYRPQRRKVEEVSRSCESGSCPYFPVF
jgi:hypothetical protein